jgi:hypothetical protein
MVDSSFGLDLFLEFLMSAVWVFDMYIWLSSVGTLSTRKDEHIPEESVKIKLVIFSTFFP